VSGENWNFKQLDELTTLDATASFITEHLQPNATNQVKRVSYLYTYYLDSVLLIVSSFASPDPNQ
jgi:hypothetical protein